MKKNNPLAGGVYRRPGPFLVLAGLLDSAAGGAFFSKALRKPGRDPMMAVAMKAKAIKVSDPLGELTALTKSDDCSATVSTGTMRVAIFGRTMGLARLNP